MRETTFYRIFFLLIFTGLFSIELQGQRIWQRIIGAPDSAESAMDVCINPDGSMVVLADVFSGFRTFVLKMDPSGNVLWKNYVPVRGTYRTIIAFDETSWLCLGTRAAADTSTINRWGGNDIVLTKINSEGNIMWSKNYGGSGNDEAVNIIKTSDGGFAVLCNSTSIDGQVVPAAPITGSERNPWVFKIDIDGNLLWQKSLEYTDDTNSEYAKGILKANDQQLYIYTSVNTTGIAYFIDQASGTVSFNNSYNGIPGVLNPSIGVPSTICKDENSDTYLFTYTSYQLDPVMFDYPNIVRRISPGGSILSIDTFVFYIPSIATTYPHAISSLPTGGYLMGGSVLIPPFPQSPCYSGYHGDDAFIYNSVTKQAVTFSTDQMQCWDDVFLSLKPLPGGDGVIAVGSTKNLYWPVDTIIYSDIWIAKISFNNTIRGSVYVDANSNNVQEAGETTLKNVKVTSTSAGTQITTQPVPTNGNYSITVPPGTYKTKPQLPRPYYTSTPDSVNTIFNTYNQLATVDFALRPIPGIKDYAVNVSDSRRVRPGFDHTYYITCTNIGTDTLTNRDLIFIKDHRFNFTSAVPAPASVSGDTILWNVSDVLPARSSSISLTLTASIIPVLNIGDTVNSSIYIDSTGDAMSADNLLQIAEIVSGSYDPNDKQENYAGNMPVKDIVDGKSIDYLIRFQNTGNDTAFTIVVRDTLDAQLDVSTFTTLDASHSYQLSIKDGKYITWTFKDIKLLDSFHNEPASHGYISYRIKPKLPIGIDDVISNRAAIYFDFNPAVLTNNQLTKVSGPAIPAVWTGAVSVAWENPANWNTNKVPDINTAVIIPAAVPNFPEVNSNAGCYSIHIDPTATVLIKAGFKLNVNGKSN